MQQRQTLTKSSVQDGRGIVERSVEAALRKSRDEIIHLVPRKEYERTGIPISLCGLDLRDRMEQPKGTENCVVCIDIRDSRKGST